MGSHGVGHDWVTLTFLLWMPSHPPVVEPLAFKPCGVWSYPCRSFWVQGEGTWGLCWGELCCRKTAGPSLFLCWLYLLQKEAWFIWLEKLDTLLHSYISLFGEANRLNGPHPWPFSSSVLSLWAAVHQPTCCWFSACPAHLLFSRTPDVQVPKSRLWEKCEVFFHPKAHTSFSNPVLHATFHSLFYSLIGSNPRGWIRFIIPLKTPIKHISKVTPYF